MKESYWFKRAHSTQRPVETYSQSFYKANNNTKQEITLPDDSLKNQIRSAAHRLLEISTIFKQNKEMHSSLSGQTAEERVGEVRCTLHNSSIILYCINDHRLLCSACVFSAENHRRHQIVQAAKAQGFLQSDLRETQKILRPKIVDIGRDRNAWQDLLEQLDKSYNKSLQILQKEQQIAAAAISLSFKKSKTKLKQVFESTRQSIQMLVNSYSVFIKCLKFEHPLLRVKHYYMQDVIQKRSSFELLFPSVKQGIQIVKIMDKFAKGIVKTFRNQHD